MKNKKINSEKVKAVLKKCLDVFCYVVTALAITLGIAMGVNSCSGSNESKRIDPQQEEPKSLRSVVIPDDLLVYVTRYEGTQDVDLSSIRSTYDVPTTISPVQRSNVRYDWYPDRSAVTAYIYVDDSFLELNRFKFTWGDFLINSDTNQFEYCLGVVNAYTPSGNFELYKKTSIYAEDDYGYFRPGKIVLSTNVVNDVAFNALYEISDKSVFTFNASFNYNAPFGLPYNAVYGSSSLAWTGGGPALKYMTYDIGWFWANGRIFNQIQWWALKGDGVSVVIDSQITTLPEGDNWVYNRMDYVNSVTGESVMVNSRDSIPYNSGNSRYYANSSTWNVPAYRNIVLLSNPTDANRDLLSSFNNNNAYDTGLSVGGDMGDVFTLVGGAFTGLLPILTLQILPSVTIGTLLFVPLVAMLVFAIIRIIKK